MVVLCVNSLPRDAYMRGKVVRDIAKIKIMTAAEKKNRPAGSPDVMFSGLITGNKIMSRNELIKTCRLVDGREITFGVLRAGQPYTVIMPDALKSNDVLIFKVPDSNKVSYIAEFHRGKEKKRVRLKPNSFVLFGAGSSLSNSNPIVIENQYFNKMCMVTEANVNGYLLRMKKALASAVQGQAELEKRREMAHSNNVAERVQAKRELEAKSVAPYSLVGKIVRKGSFEAIGYMVSNGKATKALPLNNVKQLAAQKKLRNCTIVKGPSGYFLRGIGISLDTLPVTYR